MKKPKFIIKSHKQYGKIRNKGKNSSSQFWYSIIDIDDY